KATAQPAEEAVLEENRPTNVLCSRSQAPRDCEKRQLSLQRRRFSKRTVRRTCCVRVRKLQEIAKSDSSACRGGGSRREPSDERAVFAFASSKRLRKATAQPAEEAVLEENRPTNVLCSRSQAPRDCEKRQLSLQRRRFSKRTVRRT